MYKLWWFFRPIICKIWVMLKQNEINNNSQRSRLGKRFLGFLLKAGIGILSMWFVYLSMCWGLRQIAIGQIVEMTNAKVKTSSIKVHLDGSVFIKDLELKAHQAPKEYDSTILTAKTVYGRFSVLSLLLLRPRLKELKATNFVVNAQYDLDRKKWNTSSLEIKVPSTGGKGKMPKITLLNGTLQYSKVSGNRIKIIAAVPLDATFGPAKQKEKGYTFEIKTARLPGGLGRNKLTGSWKPGSVTVTGGISSTDVPAFEKVWKIYALAAELKYDKNNDYSLKLRINDLISTDRPSGDDDKFQGQAFFGNSGIVASLEKFFRRYKPTGKIDVDLENARGNLNHMAKSSLKGTIKCKDVTICDREFPYRIEKIAGNIDFTHDGFELKNLKGTHGDVEVEFKGYSKTSGPNKIRDLSFECKNMPLNDDLYNALSEKHKKLWSNFSPTGSAAVTCRSFKEANEDSYFNITVIPKEASLTYKGFPYPLKNLKGALVFDRSSITAQNLVSEYQGHKISLNGKISKCDTDHPHYQLKIIARDIPLDSVLGDALSEKQRNFYEKLEAKGFVNADINIITADDDPHRVDVITETFFEKASIKVPYISKTIGRPLIIEDISGNAVFTDDLIDLEKLDGRIEDLPVSFRGRILFSDQDRQPQYDLVITANQINVNDKLINDFLPDSAKDILEKLQIKGNVGVDVAIVNKDNENVDYTVTVHCKGNTAGISPNDANDQLVLTESDSLLYPLTDIMGKLIITRDRLLFEDLTANGPSDLEDANINSTIRINGNVSLLKDTPQLGSFTVSARDILLDERLMQTLPENLRQHYLTVMPAGRFDLDLENLRIFNEPDKGRCVEFSGTAKFKNCNINIWPGITEMDATLQMKGLYSTDSSLCEGTITLAANRLKVMGECLTELKADFFYDRQNQAWKTKHLTADCYGGRMTGKLEFKQFDDAPSKYCFQMGLDAVDLSQFLANWVTTRSKTKNENNDLIPLQNSTQINGLGIGTLCGSISISGVIGDDNQSNNAADGALRIGKCKFTIKNMKVGKLSPLTKLLCALQLSPADFAFDEMLIDSYIMDDKLIFDHLDLSGKALAFEGTGSMNLLDHNVDIVLFARGARRLISEKPSILQSLTNSLGTTVLRMEVTGNILDPDIKKSTLPLLQQTLDFFSALPNPEKQNKTN